MIFNDIKWEEKSEVTARKETQELLGIIFKDIDINEKYFLFVKPTMYYKYKVNDIKCNIKLLDCNNNILNESKHKVRQPYPDKNWYLDSMRYGGKLLDDGYIFMFDDFEDIKMVNWVQINWSILSEYDTGEEFKVDFKVGYYTSFEHGEDNVYNIRSRDNSIVSLGNDKFREYNSQFDENSYPIVEKDDNNIDIYREYHIQNLNLKPDNSRVDL